MEKLQVVYRKTDDLIPYARNARVHDDVQITKLASVLLAVVGANRMAVGHYSPLPFS